MLTPEWRKRLYADERIQAARATKKRSEVIQALKAKRAASQDAEEQAAIDALIAELRSKAKSASSSASGAMATPPHAASAASTPAGDFESGAGSRGGTSGKTAGGVLATVLILAIVALRLFSGGGGDDGGRLDEFYLYSSLDSNVTVRIGEESVVVRPNRPTKVDVDAGVHTVQVMPMNSEEVLFEEEIEVAPSGLQVYDVFGLTLFVQTSYVFAAHQRDMRDPEEELLEHRTFHVRPEVSYSFNQPVPVEIDLPRRENQVTRHSFTVLERFPFGIAGNEPEERLALARGALFAGPSDTQRKELLEIIHRLALQHQRWELVFEVFERVDEEVLAESSFAPYLAMGDELAEIRQEAPGFFELLLRYADDAETFETLVSYDENAREVWKLLSPAKRTRLLEDDAERERLLAIPPEVVEHWILPQDTNEEVPELVRFAAWNRLEPEEVERLAALPQDFSNTLASYLRSEHHSRSHEYALFTRGTQALRYYARADDLWIRRFAEKNHGGLLGVIGRDEPPGVREALAQWSDEQFYVIAKEFARAQERGRSVQLLQVMQRRHEVNNLTVQLSREGKADWMFSRPLSDTVQELLSEAFPLDTQWELPPGIENGRVATRPTSVFNLARQVGGDFLRALLFMDRERLRQSEPTYRFDWVEERIISAEDQTWLGGLTYTQIEAWMEQSTSFDEELFELEPALRTTWLQLFVDDPAKADRLAGSSPSQRRQALHALIDE